MSEKKQEEKEEQQIKMEIEKRLARLRELQGTTPESGLIDEPTSYTIIDSSGEKPLEYRRGIDTYRNLFTGSGSRKFTDTFEGQIKDNIKKIATEKLEQKIDDICKDMEQTDKKVAKLKKKLLTEI